MPRINSDEIKEIKRALDKLFFCPTAFSLREAFMEALSALGDRTKSNIFKKTIINDKRFISFNEKITYESLFLSKRAILNKFIFLNYNLGLLNQKRLSACRVAFYMSSLLSSGKWKVLPEKIFSFGLKRGLISFAVKPEEYIFPLAHVLSYLSPNLVNIACNTLVNLEMEEYQNSSGPKYLKDLVNECLATLHEREIYIISRREGLLGSGKKTLEEVGRELGITRERVRQIEEKTWRKLNHPMRRKFLLKAFLLDFVKRGGKLTFLISEYNALYRKFILKVLGIPYAEFSHEGIFVIGASLQDFELPNNFKAIKVTGLEKDGIAYLLDSQGKICISRSEIIMICQKEGKFITKNLSKAKKVYLAMKLLGKPAHFSLIAQKYNQLFPEDCMKEHNIHGILNRENKIFVWLGLKGFYGLKEWGCQRPKKSLEGAVVEIVERNYLRTKKPVHLAKIVADLGKYRQLLNPVSLTFVTSSNPRLKRVSRDLFLPKSFGGQKKDRFFTDQIDKLLEEFSQKKKL